MKKQIISIYETNKKPKYLIHKFFKSGDLVLISFRYKAYDVFSPIIRSFFGICISLKHNNFLTVMRIRNFLGGFAIELSFIMFSTCILSVKKLRMVKGTYLRSKLYYLRNRIAWHSTVLLESL